MFCEGRNRDCGQFLQSERRRCRCGCHVQGKGRHPGRQASPYLKGCTVAGNDGAVMGYAPKLSSEKLAAKLGLDLKAIDMFEINEAFASQAFAVRRDLGLDPEKVNIYGGGISIGHPIGATGVILAVKVLYELQRTDKKDAMVSMCIGGGQGISMYFTKD